MHAHNALIFPEPAGFISCIDYSVCTRQKDELGKEAT